MATENDVDSYLDLSYMDENDTTVQNGNGNDNDTAQYDGQDDSADLYGEEEAQPDDSKPIEGQSNDTNDGTVLPDEQNVAKSEITEAPVRQESSSEDAGTSRKRKDRDEDEYSQTLSQGQSQTPRPSSTTPLPQLGYGQQPTDALNVQQLTHNTNEETIREWTNAVGREGDLVELKFDEFKPNGKSKGAVYMKFKSAEAARDVKDHIATLPKPPGQRSGYIAHYTVSNPYHRAKEAYGSNSGHQQRNNQNRPQHMNQQGGFQQNRGNFNRGGGFNNYNNQNRGGMNQNNWQQNRQANFSAGGFTPQGGFSQGHQGMGFNNMANNNFRGGMMNRGGRGGMQGGMNGMMGRGGMQNVTPPPMGGMMGRGITGTGMVGGMPNMMGGMMPNMMNGMGGMMPNMMNGMPNMMGGMRGGAMGMGAGMGNMMGGMNRGGFQGNQMNRGGGTGSQMGGPMKKARYG